MTAAADAEVAAPSEGYPPRLGAWWAVAIFFLASIFSTVDRGIIGLVVDPIRRDLNISEVQISLLQGLSFGLFYASVGLFLGLSADRLSRRRLLVFGVACWSLATLLGGFANGFTWLFICRILVGLGEAALAPAAVSMISDMFPPKQRGRPISIYLMGQAVSTGISIMMTGYIVAQAPRGTFDFIPGLAGMAPWRITFILCGAAGFIVVALLAFTISEPRRRGVVLGGAKGLGVARVWNYLVRNWKIFLPFYLGFAFMSVGQYGMAAWVPSTLIRQFGLVPGQVGQLLGGASMAAGFLGSLAAGFIVDAVARRGASMGKLVVLAVAALCAIPAAFAAFAPNAVTAALVFVLMNAIFPLVGTTVLAALQDMVPNNMRGISVSLCGFFNTIIGATSGPLLIAAATEHVFHDPKMVGFSIAAVVPPALGIASLLFFLTLLSARRALKTKGEFAEVMKVETA